MPYGIASVHLSPISNSHVGREFLKESNGGNFSAGFGTIDTEQVLPDIASTMEDYLRDNGKGLVAVLPLKEFREWNKTGHLTTPESRPLRLTSYLRHALFFSQISPDKHENWVLMTLKPPPQSLLATDSRFETVEESFEEGGVLFSGTLTREHVLRVEAILPSNAFPFIMENPEKEHFKYLFHEHNLHLRMCGFATREVANAYWLNKINDEQLTTNIEVLNAYQNQIDRLFPPTKICTINQGTNFSGDVQYVTYYDETLQPVLTIRETLNHSGEKRQTMPGVNTGTFYYSLYNQLEFEIHSLNSEVIASAFRAYFLTHIDGELNRYNENFFLGIAASVALSLSQGNLPSRMKFSSYDGFKSFAKEMLAAIHGFMTRSHSLFLKNMSILDDLPDAYSIFDDLPVRLDASLKNVSSTEEIQAAILENIRLLGERLAQIERPVTEPNTVATTFAEIMHPSNYLWVLLPLDILDGQNASSVEINDNTLLSNRVIPLISVLKGRFQNKPFMPWILAKVQPLDFRGFNVPDLNQPVDQFFNKTGLVHYHGMLKILQRTGILPGYVLNEHVESLLTPGGFGARFNPSVKSDMILDHFSRTGLEASKSKKANQYERFYSEDKQYVQLIQSLFQDTRFRNFKERAEEIIAMLTAEGLFESNSQFQESIINKDKENLLREIARLNLPSDYVDELLIRFSSLNLDMFLFRIEPTEEDIVSLVIKHFGSPDRLEMAIELLESDNTLHFSPREREFVMDYFTLLYGQDAVVEKQGKLIIKQSQVNKRHRDILIQMLFPELSSGLTAEMDPDREIIHHIQVQRGSRRQHIFFDNYQRPTMIITTQTDLVPGKTFRNHDLKTMIRELEYTCLFDYTQTPGLVQKIFKRFFLMYTDRETDDINNLFFTHLARYLSEAVLAGQLPHAAVFTNRYPVNPVPVGIVEPVKRSS